MVFVLQEIMVLFEETILIDMKEFKFRSFRITDIRMVKMKCKYSKLLIMWF